MRFLRQGLRFFNTFLTIETAFAAVSSVATGEMQAFLLRPLTDKKPAAPRTASTCKARQWVSPPSQADNTDLLGVICTFSNYDQLTDYTDAKGQVQFIHVSLKRDGKTNRSPDDSCRKNAEK